MNTIAWTGIISTIVFIAVVVYKDLGMKIGLLLNFVGALTGISAYLCSIAVFFGSISSTPMIISGIIFGISNYYVNFRKRYPHTAGDYANKYLNLALNMLPCLVYIFINLNKS